MRTRFLLVWAVAATACTPPGNTDGGDASGSCSDSEECPHSMTCSGGWCVPVAGDAVEIARGSVAHLRTESVRFTDVGRGVAQQRLIRLSNLGDETLDVDRIDVTGTAGRVSVSPDPEDFIIAVPPTGEYSFTVTFSGSDGVAFVGAISLFTNDRLAETVTVPVVVSYTGTPQVVVTAAPDGQHTEDLDGASLSLGPVPADGSRQRVLYLKNLGVGGAFAWLEAPLLLGADADAFSAELGPNPDPDGTFRLGRYAGFCNGAGDCPRPGSSCDGHVCWVDGVIDDCLQLTVTVTAAVGATVSANAEVAFRAPDGTGAGTLALELSAFGVEPGLYLDPASVDFGAVSVGFPDSQVVRLVNASAAEIVIDGIELVGPGAEPPGPPVAAAVLFGPLPATLAAGAEGWVRLDFVATTSRLGPAAASLVVEGPTETLGTVSVTGVARIGPAIVTVPLAEVALGAVHVGTSGLATVTVSNAGSPGADPLTLSGITTTLLSGEGSVAVNPSAPPPPIPAGSNAALTVSCTPTARGELVGQLQIQSDAPDNPARTLGVSCRGVDPELRLVYPSRDAAAVGAFSSTDEHPCDDGSASPCMDLGEVLVGQSTELAIELANLGEDSLTIGALLVEPAGGDFELAVPFIPLTLAPGAAQEIGLVFNGDGLVGDASAALRVRHSDADLGGGEVLLNLVASEAACDPTLRLCADLQACLAEGTTAACCRAASDPEACGPACEPCAYYSHTVRSCDGSACAYACQPGFFDYDASPGCEYECFATNGGVESCDRIDNDCDGQLDEELGLGDGASGALEAPATCTPANVDGRLGPFDESDLGAIVIGEAGALASVADFSGRLYQAGANPSGDVDWLRLLFAEVNACAAIGFRVEVEVASPAGVDLELCGRLNDPAGAPLFDVPCDELAGSPLFDGCVSVSGQPLRFEWPEICGVADDRVLDLRLRAADGATGAAAASCEPYLISISGARLY